MTADLFSLPSRLSPFVQLQGNCLELLKQIPDNSVQACVTSPPYWALRDYGTNSQIWGGDEICPHEFEDKSYQRRSSCNTGNNGNELQTSNRGSLGRDMPAESSVCTLCGAWRGEFGLEPTPELYVDHLVMIFREVRRVLKNNGTLWLNLGDSYYAGKGQSGSQGKEYQQLRAARNLTINRSSNFVGGKNKTRPQDRRHPFLKPKDLVGIPWMAAFALRNDGWFLRQDCIWHKPNPMPESVRDRCTKAHEYLFLLSKSRTYHFDNRAIFEPARYDNRKKMTFQGSPKYRDNFVYPGQMKGQSLHVNVRQRWRTNELGELIRNKRTVWTVPTAQSKSSHTATYPEKLIEPCVLASAPEGSIILDIFSGTATTGAVALKNKRFYLGLELNPEHLQTGSERLQKTIENQREKEYAEKK